MYKNAIKFPSLFGEKITYPEKFLRLHRKLYCSYAPDIKGQIMCNFQAKSVLALNKKNF